MERVVRSPYRSCHITPAHNRWPQRALKEAKYTLRIEKKKSSIAVLQIFHHLQERGNFSARFAFVDTLTAPDSHWKN